MSVGGDVSFSGIICYLAKKGYCKYNDSFTLLQPVTDETDFVLVNLESPVGNTEIPPKKLDEGKQVHLMAEEKSLEAFKLVNIYYKDLGTKTNICQEGCLFFFTFYIRSFRQIDLV